MIRAFLDVSWVSGLHVGDALDGKESRLGTRPETLLAEVVEVVEYGSSSYGERSFLVVGPGGSAVWMPLEIVVLNPDLDRDDVTVLNPQGVTS